MDHAALTLTLALAAGVLANSLARHARVPGIVLLLATGALLGPDLLGWIDPASLGGTVFAIVHLGVPVILFEGGLNLELSRLRREQDAIRRLISVGALVTLVGGALCARLLLGWGWAQCALFGSLVVVTGPTVVTPLVRELRLRPRLATVLDAEGVLIDPIGVILAVLVLDIVVAPASDTVATEALGLVYRLGFGVLAGSGGGLLLAGLLRVPRLVPEGFENIFTLAFVLLLFSACEEVISESGIMAVTVAGVCVGNARTRVQRDLREFKDQLTVLLIGLLFVLLAADVRLEDVRGLGAGGVAVVAALIALIRPLGVLASTAGSELSWRERGFLAWIAPRGIVAAGVASLTAQVMEAHEIPGGPELRALVFLTIAITVVLAGLTAGPVAGLLRLRLPGRDTVAILGAQGLGLALGLALRERGVPVVFLDSNPQHCRSAEDEGFPVVFGNALEERTLQRARFDLVGTAVGLTPNESLNSMFVQQAAHEFGVPRRLVALTGIDSGVTPAVAARYQAEPLFAAAHDVERWDVRLRRNEVELVHLTFRARDEEEEPAEEEKPVAHGERFAILALVRGERVAPMSTSTKPRDGDAGVVAVYRPEREEALARLRELGWLEEAVAQPGGET